VSTQTFEQYDSPGWQSASHMPLVHADAASHTVVHLPQFCSSFSRSVQMPLHPVCPAGQGGLQTLPLQTSGAVQAMPHAPQLFVSVCGSMHDAPHSINPAPHGDTQDPAAHCPLVQTFPHSPQLAGSPPRSTQSPSQSVSFAAQSSSSSSPLLGLVALVAHAPAVSAPTADQTASMRTRILILLPLC
jgi:hypothetical protein